jgi:hypothetical protein
MNIHISPVPSTWSTEQQEMAIAMWRDGYTGSQIANVIGKTRSAVIAWLNRRKARKGYRVQVINQYHAAPIHKAAAQAKPADVPVVPQPYAGTLNCSIVDLMPGQCRFICEGTGSDSLYCGQPTSKGSWCAHHHGVVFWPDAPKMKQSKTAWWGQ